MFFVLTKTKDARASLSKVDTVYIRTHFVNNEIGLALCSYCFIWVALLFGNPRYENNVG